MKLATLSTWKGHPAWRCRLCPKVETNRERMIAHGQDFHRLRITFDVPDVAGPEPSSIETADTPEKTAEEEGHDAEDRTPD